MRMAMNWKRGTLIIHDDTREICTICNIHSATWVLCFVITSREIARDHICPLLLDNHQSHYKC